MTQELIYGLKNKVDVKVYVDSPMASAATAVFRKNIQDFNAEYKARVMAGDDPLDFANLIFTHSTDESKELNALMTPKIIISASGMCEAGRILHHLKHRLWDPRSAIVFVGYQAEGTLGRRLVDGAKTVSVLGEAIDVNAEIVNLEGFSAHADRDGLLEWVRGFDTPPKSLFLVHGEYKAKTAFAETLYKEIGLKAIVVDELNSWELGHGGRLVGDYEEEVEEKLRGLSEPSVVAPEDMERLLSKLRNINDNMENLLYRTKLAAVEAANEGDAESYTALKNIIASLESDTSKLAGELADRRRVR